MTKSDSFWDHPLDKLEEALSLRKQIQSLQTQLSSLFGSAAPAVKTRKSGRRTVSAAARAKISAAQKARWAKGRTSTAVAAPAAKKGRAKMSAAGKARIAVAQKARWAKVKADQGLTAIKKVVGAKKSAGRGKRKSGLTDAGRARLAAAMKARWAARKKGSAAPNSRAK